MFCLRIIGNEGGLDDESLFISTDFGNEDYQNVSNVYPNTATDQQSKIIVRRATRKPVGAD